MSLRMRLAALVAVVTLLCTGCTDGRWLDQTRLSFHTDGDGKRFTARTVDHSALTQEDLSVSAIGVAGEKLMIAGATGPADAREFFGISIDVPKP